jgi:hypothetical protein
VEKFRPLCFSEHRRGLLRAALRSPMVFDQKPKAKNLELKTQNLKLKTANSWLITVGCQLFSSRRLCLGEGVGGGE